MLTQTMKPIEAIWRELSTSRSAGAPIFRRVSDAHPLDFYAGVDTDGSKLLMLVSIDEPPGLSPFQAFAVERNKRDDGRWSTCVRLVRPELVGIFGQLCDDLLASALIDWAPEEAAHLLVARILSWQRLLSRDTSSLLSGEEIRGLLGELLFLRHLLKSPLSADIVVRAWEGPLDAVQDFRLPNIHAEVKTISPSGTSVWISSAEQLDTAGSPIVLAVVTLEASSPNRPDSFTLVGLVDELNAQLARFAPAREEFEQKLKLAGFAASPAYERDCFTVRQIRLFQVQDHFPRIERSRLPNAIGAMRYQLDVSKCSPFEVQRVGFETWTLTSFEKIS